MVADLPNLAGAGWFADAGVRKIFATLEQEREAARIVGGAVRNALIGVPVGDIDFATTAPPETVTRLAGAAGLKAVPTGFDHGTVTLVVDGTGYEVTTLREDVETDGRRATVRFGRDWTADAERRDFTVNALSLDSQGRIHDPLGGYDDILAGRIRFIGAPERRIAEDRLRVLRFFRLHAEYGSGALDGAGLSAATRARHDLAALSAERIGQEMRRLVVARRAAEVVAVMQEYGILPLILAGVAYLAVFARAVEFEDSVAAAPSVALRLAALGCRVREDVERLTQRLRLANAEAARMQVALAAAAQVAAMKGAAGARAALYRLGGQAFCDGIVLAVGRSALEAEAARETYRLPERWQPPRFPLSGRDALAAGLSGPAVGAILRELENWWIGQDFVPDSATLKVRLQQMAAAQQ